MQSKQVGGSAGTTQLADEFIKMLMGGLTGQGFGAAGGRTGSAAVGESGMNMFSVLNNVLAGGGGEAGASINQMIQRDIERQSNALRARFNQGGGMAMGTPAAYAESNLRAEAAPRATQAITEMQMQALMPLMQIMTGMASKGITQREEVMQPSPFMQFMSAMGPVLGNALPMMAGMPPMPLPTGTTQPSGQRGTAV